MRTGTDPEPRAAFPPGAVVAVKALACELPHKRGLPLSRLSLAEIRREVIRQGLVTQVGKTTLWRWLSEDAIRPWRHHTWIYPRDPAFAEKAGRVLDLYEGSFEGAPLTPTDCIISADEKTSIQARCRIHAPEPPAPGTVMRVEHGYTRQGALAYLAAWDVRRARVMGRCEATTGREPFARLLEDVMSQEPYASASRVFLVVDNGSSHRGERCAVRLRQRWKNLIMVPTPVHASWLNQVEIYFSILQRKVLSPNDFSSPAELKDRILAFQTHYEHVARPFRWKFTRKDMDRLLRRLNGCEQTLCPAA